jgi:hypothetical protein
MTYAVLCSDKPKWKQQLSQSQQLSNQRDTWVTSKSIFILLNKNWIKQTKVIILPNIMTCNWMLDQTWGCARKWLSNDHIAFGASSTGGIEQTNNGISIDDIDIDIIWYWYHDILSYIIIWYWYHGPLTWQLKILVKSSMSRVFKGN